MDPQNIAKFLRKSSLFLGVMLGFLGFLLFTYVESARPLRGVAIFLVDSLPFFLFVLLFFSFCKVRLLEMRPRRWHLMLSVFQIVMTGAMVAYIVFFKPSPNVRLLIEGCIICLISPTAASAAVITGRLGGNESAQVTYTIISNVVAAVFIPLYFPFICSTTSGSFITDMLMIMHMVFPILILPLILTMLLRRFSPGLHQILTEFGAKISFSLWIFILIIQSARIFYGIYKLSDSTLALVLMCVIGFVFTLLLFFIGQIVGSLENQRISAGQGLGQKNTVFGIWVSMLYLSPLVAIVPGSYLLWQNLFNAVQMIFRERDNERRTKSNLPLYKE